MARYRADLIETAWNNELIYGTKAAALDKENSSKIVGVIKEISRASQFLVITHNDPLIQNANQIVGVALNKQKSSVVGLKLKDELKTIKT